jgi:hypothetical protein
LHCEINFTIVCLEIVLCAPLYKQERPVQRQDCESALGNGPCLDFSHTIPHRSPFANHLSSCASQCRWHSTVPANGNHLLESALRPFMCGERTQNYAYQLTLATTAANVFAGRLMKGLFGPGTAPQSVAVEMVLMLAM